MGIPAAELDQSRAVERAPLRFVSAASLFDGHDAAINIIRRILQAHETCAEVPWLCASRRLAFGRP